MPWPAAPTVEEGAPVDKARARPSQSPYRLDWAAARKRVQGIDVLKCARSGGRLVVLAFIEKRTAPRAILDHLRLPSAPLPLGKARAPNGRPRVASGARACGGCGPPQLAWGY